MQLINLIKRNMKVYFSDKTMFYTSLITPIILLILYATFLSNVFKTSFLAFMPPGIENSEDLVNGVVSSQILASLLSVSCVTISFNANLLIVMDKSKKVRKDFDIAPISSSSKTIAYVVSAFLSALLINMVALVSTIIYTYFNGGSYNALDILLLSVDVILLTLLGTSLSSVVCFALSKEGQVSAASTIISSGYGFICGAYMPISSFGSSLQNILKFLPSTYASTLVKNHAFASAFNKLANNNIPEIVITNIKQSLDVDISVFNNKVGVEIMCGVVILTIALLVIINLMQHKYSKVNRKI